MYKMELILVKQPATTHFITFFHELCGGPWLWRPVHGQLPNLLIPKSDPAEQLTIFLLFTFAHTDCLLRLSFYLCNEIINRQQPE